MGVDLFQVAPILKAKFVDDTLVRVIFRIILIHPPTSTFLRIGLSVSWFLTWSQRIVINEKWSGKKVDWAKMYPK